MVTPKRSTARFAGFGSVTSSLRHSVTAPAFILIDVLIATILLGVSLAVIIGLAGRAITSQQRGEQIATAASLADQQLELVLARGPDDYARRFPVEAACDPPFENYRYKLEFSGGGTVGEPFKVTATISWSLAALPQSITIETLVASRNAGEDGESDPVRRPDQPVVRTP